MFNESKIGIWKPPVDGIAAWLFTRRRVKAAHAGSEKKHGRDIRDYFR
ncbi:hypothetical protein BN1221_03004 [Brenneria goodwinii]|uniref:Uncharacterized protein n=1 Tax=Brenneria goodwinii TaxID=1109412 RepID=A0A0G4JXA6_9GAMM|nr:hypothetical protein BN1221_03004 [Brenneria goodwinii]